MGIPLNGAVAQRIAERLPSVKLPPDTDAAQVGEICVSYLNSLEPSHFTEKIQWRDIISLTGTWRTFRSPEIVAAAFNECCKLRQAGKFQVVKQLCRVGHFGPKHSWVEVGFSFEADVTPASTGAGLLNIIPDDAGGWKIWMMATWLEELKGQPNVDILTPTSTESQSNGAPGLTNGKSETAQAMMEFDCVVLGAGQNGLSLTGRLKALGIKTLLIEKGSRVGDNWRHRYDTVKLHTPRNFAHLPFEKTFPDHHPEYLGKDILADNYERWAKAYGLDILLSTSVINAQWLTEDRKWKVCVDNQGTISTIHCKHFVLSVGQTSTTPYMPDIPGMSEFQGTITHSGNFTSSSKWKTQRGIIFGAANTAHDVLEDMVESGLSSVTLFQNRPTWLLDGERMVWIISQAYNEHLPTDVADRVFQTAPFDVQEGLADLSLFSGHMEKPHQYDAIEQAGFRVDWGGSVINAVCERAGGHFMDMGASKYIADGRVKVKKSASVKSFTTNGLLLENDEKLLADVVVFCTGFLPLTEHVATSIFGKEIASTLEPLWGFDAERELRGAFKPCGHPGIWMAAGDVSMARFFSRFLALQIKADLLGHPFTVYEKDRPT